MSEGLLSKIFKSLTPYHKNEGEAQGVSEISATGYEYLSNTIYAITSEKRSLHQEYKEMSQFPEIGDAVDEIVFEAISPDEDNQILSLRINDTDLAENENVVQNLQKEFDYVINKVLDFDTTASDLFRKFYIEGELYAELMVNPEKKEKGLQGVQYLPAYTMKVDWDDNQDPIKFTQDLTSIVSQSPQKARRSGNEIVFEPAQIAYINSGIVDFQKNLAYSYLERAKVAYRQLKWMENALLVYRITRAPERRVFYIDVGKLPKNKADEYIKSLIARTRNKKIYNPSTGDIDSGKDVMNMEESFYFPTRDNGQGSRVETLPGADNLGQIEDITYFLKKLYKALKIPQLRLTPETPYNPGRSNEVSREEVKFAKWVDKIRGRFLEFIYQVFFTHLQLKGLYKQYNLNRTKISIQFNENNAWKELKDLEMYRARIDIMKDLIEFKDDIFPVEFLYRDIMKFSDDKVKEVKEMLKNQATGKAPDAEEEEESPEEDKEAKKNKPLLTGNPNIEKEKIQ